MRAPHQPPPFFFFFFFWSSNDIARYTVVRSFYKPHKKSNRPEFLHLVYVWLPFHKSGLWIHGSFPSICAHCLIIASYSPLFRFPSCARTTSGYLARIMAQLARPNCNIEDTTQSSPSRADRRTAFIPGHLSRTLSFNSRRSFQSFVPLAKSNYICLQTLSLWSNGLQPSPWKALDRALQNTNVKFPIPTSSRRVHYTLVAGFWSYTPHARGLPSGSWSQWANTMMFRVSALGEMGLAVGRKYTGQKARPRTSARLAFRISLPFFWKVVYRLQSKFKLSIIQPRYFTAVRAMRRVKKKTKNTANENFINILDYTDRRHDSVHPESAGPPQSKSRTQ